MKTELWQLNISGGHGPPYPIIDNLLAIYL